MKLMIVDDSALIQERLQTAIHKIDKSIEVSQAYNCAEARKLFASFKPDTAILDISLPDGNGISLIEEFRMQSPGIKILMMTNFSSGDLIKKCFEKGADDFFDKMDLVKLLQCFQHEVI